MNQLAHLYLFVCSRGGGGGGGGEGVRMYTISLHKTLRRQVNHSIKNTFSHNN